MVMELGSTVGGSWGRSWAERLAVVLGQPGAGSEAFIPCDEGPRTSHCRTSADGSCRRARGLGSTSWQLGKGQHCEALAEARSRGAGAAGGREGLAVGASKRRASGKGRGHKRDVGRSGKEEKMSGTGAGAPKLREEERTGLLRAAGGASGAVARPSMMQCVAAAAPHLSFCSAINRHAAVPGRPPHSSGQHSVACGGARKNHRRPLRCMYPSIVYSIYLYFPGLKCGTEYPVPTARTPATAARASVVVR